MFAWDKSSEGLNVPVERVLRLYRSLGNIQVALPGLPSQLSAVYLCAYAGTKGGQVVVCFHLLNSGTLAIYRHDQGEVPPPQMKGLLEEGIRFAESLGFVLDPVDFQQMSSQEKRDYWQELPLFQRTKMGLPSDLRTGTALPGRVSTVPGSEELRARRRFFIEKLGRFLATM